MPSGISPGGRPIDESPLSHSKSDNWVAKRGGLPPYVRGIARGVARSHGGPVTSRDIRIAIEQIKKLSATSKNPAVRAAATAALAHWEAMKGGDLSNENAADIELSWDTFDAARGTHPRQKKAQPVATGTVAGYDGPAMNADTIQAIKNFQRDNHLPVTGNLDPHTLAYATAYPERVAAAKAGVAAGKKAAAAATKAQKAAAAKAKKAAAAKTKAAKKAASAKTKAEKAAAAKAKKAAKAKAVLAKKTSAAGAAKNKAANAAALAEQRQIAKQNQGG